MVTMIKATGDAAAASASEWHRIDVLGLPKPAHNPFSESPGRRLPLVKPLCYSPAGDRPVQLRAGWAARLLSGRRSRIAGRA
jgi:hypothetical protein